MRINHNIQALNAYRNLSQTMASTSKSLEKLSSGLRINKAADDAAGLAISEKMRSQIRGLDMAERNTLDAISLIQTGEGALNEVHSILQRMRELSVQAANGTLETQDREAIQTEMDQLTKEIDRIADTTQFNQKKLFSGSEEGRMFANANSDLVVYDTAAKKWIGTVTAESTDPASVEIKVDQEFGKLGASEVDGKTFTIGGVVYEIEASGGTAGVTDGHIAVNVTWVDSAITDADILNNVNNLLSALESAINTSNPTFNSVEKTDASDSDSGNDGTNFSGKLVLTTVEDMSPKDASALEVRTTVTAGVEFVDPADSTTTVTSLVANDKGLNAASVPITFSEVPKAGDYLTIDGLTINFTDTPPTASYSSGTTAEIDITGKDIFSVVNEIKNILTTAKGDTTNNPVVHLADNFDVVGTTLLIGTTYTETEPPAGLVIELFDGDFEANRDTALDLTFQIGANSSESLSVSINVMDAGSLGIGRDSNGNPVTAGINAEHGVDVMSAEAAQRAIDFIDNAVKIVSTERSKLGAIQNRLEHTANNLQTASENLTSAESRVRDVDMAEEMTNFTRNNILNQAGQAMLAQANQLPQGILQLLQ